MDVIEAGFPAASPGDWEAVHRIAQETKGVAVAALARCRDGDPQRADRGDPGRRAAAPPRLHRDLRHPPQAQAPDGPRRGARRGGPLGPLRPRAARPRRRDRVLAPRTPRRTDPEYLLAGLRGGRRRPAPPRSTSRTRSATRSRPSSGRSSGGSSTSSGATRPSRVHCHNDLGLATANTLAAVQAGARQVEVTINGLGERAGNASLEEVVMALRTRPTQFPRAGQPRPDRADHGRQPARQPPDRLRHPAQQGGRRAPTPSPTRSGIHQDGVIKNPLTYEIMTPQSVGLSGSQLTIGKLSGRKGLQKKLRDLGHDVEGEALDVVYREAIALADVKKEVTDADLLALVEQRAARRAGRRSSSRAGASPRRHGGRSTGSVRRHDRRRGARPARRPATGRSTPSTGPSTRRSGRSSAGSRRSSSTRSRRSPRARTRRAGSSSAAAARSTTVPRRPS